MGHGKVKAAGKKFEVKDFMGKLRLEIYNLDISDFSEIKEAVLARAGVPEKAILTQRGDLHGIIT